MKTDRELFRAAVAEGYVRKDGQWYRREYCAPEEQKALAKLESTDAGLPEDVLYDDGEMRWYRLVPADLQEAEIREIMLRRTYREIRHVKKLCIAILAVIAAFAVFVVLFLIYNARETLG